MNTANAAGCLIGALIDAPLTRQLGVRLVFLGGIVLTAVLLAASAATGSLAVLLILRLLAGRRGCVAVGSG